MDATQVRTRLEVFATVLDELGVKTLWLFGSAAKGLVHPGSDLDFLVEFDGPATFDAYMGVKELLEGAFSVHVDLVTIRALKPSMRDQVLGEAVKVA